MTVDTSPCPVKGTPGKDCPDCVWEERTVNGVKLIPYYEGYIHGKSCQDNHDFVGSECIRKPKEGENPWSIPRRCVDRNTDPFVKCKKCGQERMLYI